MPAHRRPTSDRTNASYGPARRDRHRRWRCRSRRSPMPPPCSRPAHRSARRRCAGRSARGRGRPARRDGARRPRHRRWWRSRVPARRSRCTAPPPAPRGAPAARCRPQGGPPAPRRRAPVRPVGDAIGHPEAALGPADRGARQQGRVTGGARQVGGGAQHGPRFVCSPTRVSASASSTSRRRALAAVRIPIAQVEGVAIRDGGLFVGVQGGGAPRGRDGEGEGFPAVAAASAPARK